jgi:predicted nucleic acid-binding protein
VPNPVATGRATIIDVSEPLADVDEAQRWLQRAGEKDLEAGIAVLNEALHAFRVVTVNPHLFPVGRRQALVARLGFGDGEQVAEGHWSDARELLESAKREPRAKVLQPQARLAAVLGGRERALVCEELVLRARLDLDSGRDREAALQVLVGLDAAVAELQSDPAAPTLEERLDELRGHREAIAHAAQAALAGPLSAPDRAAVERALLRIEAALRARAVVNA